MKIRKIVFSVIAVLLFASVAFASPLDTLKSTWEQGAERWTEAQRLGNTSNGVWSRMQRPVGTGNSATEAALPAGYDPNGEILPFMKIVADHSGGRVRYETMGYSYHGVPIPLAIVGFPQAPKGPEDVGDRVIIRWQCAIHGNENDGSEAALIFLREVAQGKHDAILKNVVLLVTPAANPDGKNRQARFIADPYEDDPNLAGPSGSSVGLDPNRGFSKSHSPEIQAAMRIYRKWDAHIFIDHHNISGPRHRHIVTYTTGSWANTDPEISAAGRRYAESIFGDGIGKYANPETNFYKNYLKKFIEDYSPGNAAGNPLFSLSDATINDNNTYSPTRNKDISLAGFPYMESLSNGIITRVINGVSTQVREVTRLPSPSSDSSRSSAATPPTRNRWAVLMEIYTTHHTWLKVHAMYAAVISATEQAGIQKDEILTFFRGKDAEYRNLNNDSPAMLTTTNLGVVDYRNSGNSAGGNEGAPFRKFVSNENEMGWGPGIFKVDGFAYQGTTTTINRFQDYTHYAITLIRNLPQYPTKMGAFYVMDPRATNAAQHLMRQGVEVYKLKEDITLPYGSTFKMYGPGGSENWGVTKNRTRYIGINTTKLPRPRAEVIDNYSTEANKLSWDFRDASSPADAPVGTPWLPLTTAQTPSLEDAPEAGGGDWMLAPVGHVAKAGYYVIPTAQKIARYAAFQMEPRSNCGLLLWAHWDPAVGGNLRGTIDISKQFNLDLVKTFDYNAIPLSALERIHFEEDLNLKPENPFGPAIFENPANLSAPTAMNVMQDKMGDFTVTIKSALLHNEMWLTFYFYDEANGVWLENGVLAKVSQVAPGVVEAFFKFDELAAAGLVYGDHYSIQYTNAMGDIFGYSAPKALYFDNIVVNVMPSAEVIKLNGNKNTLIITVVEQYAGGEKAKFVKEFSIDNNAAATYVVGPYKVYVDTKGNTQIRACYIVN